MSDLVLVDNLLITYKMLTLNDPRVMFRVRVKVLKKAAKLTLPDPQPLGLGS